MNCWIISSSHIRFTIAEIKKRGWDKSPSLSIVFGLSSKTQWLSGLYYADFISFYSPTQLCGGGTTKSNSNELPISVPLSFCFLSSDKTIDYCNSHLRTNIQFLFFQDNFSNRGIFFKSFQFFWVADEGDDIAFLAHATRSTRTVGVGFQIARHFVVDYAF